MADVTQPQTDFIADFACGTFVLTETLPTFWQASEPMSEKELMAVRLRTPGDLTRIK